MSVMNPQRTGYTDTDYKQPATTNGAYAPGDVVGGLLAFGRAARGGQRGAVITLTTVTVRTATAVEIDLFFYDAAPTTVADNGAFALQDADEPKLLGVYNIPSGDFRAAGSGKFVASVPMALSFKADTLYAYAVARAALTLTATAGLTVKLGSIQD